ncbi:MAG TPA: FAA hydrolase family protein [Sulfurovum sp.]|nr:FAA hydrolase family protein [Sulfurovum sp.]
MKEVIIDGKKVIPSKLVCIGRNYVEHIKELDNEMPENMVIFNKPNSAISNKLNYFSPKCRFEGELCLLIIDKQIAGLGLGLDLTHADIQNKQKEKGLPWERAKAFDGSAVLSDFVPFSADLKDIHFQLSINGILAQEADYALMIYKPKEMLAEISSFMTLEDGDIIMTGTPKGVGTYIIGDLFEMKLYNNDILLLEVSWKVQ